MTLDALLQRLLHLERSLSISPECRCSCTLSPAIKRPSRLLVSEDDHHFSQSHAHSHHLHDHHLHSLGLAGSHFPAQSSESAGSQVGSFAPKPSEHMLLYDPGSESEASSRPSSRRTSSLSQAHVAKLLASANAALRGDAQTPQLQQQQFTGERLRMTHERVQAHHKPTASGFMSWRTGDRSDTPEEKIDTRLSASLFEPPAGHVSHLSEPNLPSSLTLSNKLDSPQPRATAVSRSSDDLASNASNNLPNSLPSINLPESLLANAQVDELPKGPLHFSIKRKKLVLPPSLLQLGTGLDSKRNKQRTSTSISGLDSIGKSGLGSTSSANVLLLDEHESEGKSATNVFGTFDPHHLTSAAVAANKTTKSSALEHPDEFSSSIPIASLSSSSTSSSSSSAERKHARGKSRNQSATVALPLGIDLSTLSGPTKRAKKRYDILTGTEQLAIQKQKETASSATPATTTATSSTSATAQPLFVRQSSSAAVANSLHSLTVTGNVDSSRRASKSLHQSHQHQHVHQMQHQQREMDVPVIHLPGYHMAAAHEPRM